MSRLRAGNDNLYAAIERGFRATSIRSASKRTTG